MAADTTIKSTMLRQSEQTGRGVRNVASHTMVADGRAFIYVYYSGTFAQGVDMMNSQARQDHVLTQAIEVEHTEARAYIADHKSDVGLITHYQTPEDRDRDLLRRYFGAYVPGSEAAELADWVAGLSLGYIQQITGLVGQDLQYFHDRAGSLLAEMIPAYQSDKTNRGKAPDAPPGLSAKAGPAALGGA